MDGNDTLPDSDTSKLPKHIKMNKTEIALNLPTIACYNARSIFPKIESLKTDMQEKSISLSLISEIWEQQENKKHAYEIEKMLELSGFKYISTPRQSGTRGGGAAIVANIEKYSLQKLSIIIPNNLDVVWGLLKPKFTPVKYRHLIICSFYSPPNKRKNSKMADHLVGTLQMLNTQYPESGIIMGADINSMDIRPILNCGLKLKNIVTEPTINGKILDVIFTNLGSYYNCPVITAPLLPDNPDTAQPSDHFVPVATPHTDKYNPPHRTWKLRVFRPLPDSRVRQFGQWITGEDWGQLSSDSSATELASEVEQILQENLDKYCPTNSIKIGSQDKPFINAELKRIHRLKSREYCKRGKTLRYKSLSEEFRVKYKAEAKKYLHKNVESLKFTNPGRAYSTLKRLGAQPGDTTDANTFTLPNHASENLTAQQSADRIAEHFAAISSEFPALSVKNLPERVLTKLGTDKRPPPTITPEQTWKKIEAANKPNAGVPCDLPRQFLKEFSVELTAPLTQIISQMVKSGTWPTHWKREFITPISKIPDPESEDDLRPISLTPFFSKVAEHFVVKWLLDYIEDQIDIRQFGGMKANSITHYLIEFMNFILSDQESKTPTAILACFVDFSKAFNRQNHNILITKLSDMGVPAWLLKNCDGVSVR